MDPVGAGALDRGDLVGEATEVGREDRRGDAAPAYLRSGGWMLCEFGAGQARQIALLFERARAYKQVTFAYDAAGTPRVAVAERA